VSIRTCELERVLHQIGDCAGHDLPIDLHLDALIDRPYAPITAVIEDSQLSSERALHRRWLAASSSLASSFD
jgi:hypothetical protein